MTCLPQFLRISRDVMTLSVLAVPVLVTLSPRTASADETPAASSGPASPGPASPGPASPQAPTQPAGPPPPLATVVELSADDGRATIERRMGTMSPSGMPLVETGLFTVGQWEHACVAPCSVKLDTRFAYRVAGEGLVPTESFGLPHSADRVRVGARMGSSTGRVAGVVSTGMGIAAIAAGGLALIATPILHSEDIGSEGFRTGVLAGGIGAVSIGAIAVGIGTVLWFANGSTARTQIASR